MNKYVKISVTIVLLELVLIAAVNIFMFRSVRTEDAIYRVEAARIMEEIEAGTPCNNVTLSAYPDIIAVSPFDPDIHINNDYLVLKDNSTGTLYCIEYTDSSYNTDLILSVDIGLGAMLLISIFVFTYLQKVLVKPFTAFTNLPYELSRGNLTVPVKENKNRFFGKFLWGMDMLRENLEEQKQEELRLMKENKTLILSLSHDIKTPLSSIKLYSKALSSGLYETSPEKKSQAVEGIRHNAEEIEKYVNEIVKASNEDFLNLKAHADEIYLSQVLNDISLYYTDKLAVNHTEFTIAEYSDCVLIADKDRLIEVIQNIIENAIKYGDGKFIDISVSEEENCKLIRIHNTGDKIPESEISHIFDSFYRGSNIKDKQGTGLGLYICRTLMHLMNGDIFVDLEEDGVSFTVVVRKA